MAVPAGGFPVPKPVTIRKKAKWSYYQNVCTQSYSMWWYAWEDWEKNLDWAALWGVNLVLAYTGSRRRDCHSADIPSPSILKRLPKGEGGAAE